MSSDSRFVFSITQAGLKLVSGVNADFTIFETITSVPPVFEFKVLNAAPDLSFKTVNTEVYSINYIPPGVITVEKNIMNAYINSAEYDAGPPDTTLTFYFERAEYRALKTTHITKSWEGESVTLSSVLDEICGEAGLNATVLVKEDSIIKNLQFDDFTAIQCIDYLADRYGLIYFYQLNRIVIYDDLESLFAGGYTLLTDDILNTKDYKQFNANNGIIENAKWVRILFNPTYKPGTLITSKTDAVSGVFRLHTIIHRIIGKLFYTDLLLIPTNANIETLKFINTSIMNDVFYKLTNDLRREIKKEMELKVGKVVNYRSQDHLVDLAIVDASPFPSVEGEPPEDATPVTKKQILTQIAGDGYGLICPSYPNERVLIARLNDHDYVVLGKVFDASMSKPNHSQGEYVLWLPEGSKLIELATNVDIEATETEILDGTEIKLGKNAALGVARLNDPITIDTAFTAWATGMGWVGGPITGKITGASSKVKSE